MTTTDYPLSEQRQATGELLRDINVDIRGLMRNVDECINGEPADSPFIGEDGPVPPMTDTDCIRRLRDAREVLEAANESIQALRT